MRWTALLPVVLAIPAGFAGAALWDVSGLGDRATHDYLLANPEVLPQAVDVLQKREQAKRIGPLRADLERPFPGAVLGNPAGKVTLVEFSDYACTYCRASVADVNALIAANPDLRVVVREYPILHPESVDAAVTSMTTLNGTASRIMRNFAVHACSDVTGFALLGHSQEMAAGSEVTIVLESRLLPLLPGAAQLAEEGHLTGGCRRNRAYLQDKVVVDLSVGAGLVEIGFDPQTSGGLLIALPRADAPRLVAELHASGISAATIVGHATSYQGTRVKLM